MGFQIALEEFYESSDLLIANDRTGEFDEQVNEQFRAATEQNYDPFKAKLEKTLKNYQLMLQQDQF